jgi:hypothetical protein
MGLSWQQGPLGRGPNGTFLTATPMPERVLYLEALHRRMSVAGTLDYNPDPVEPPAEGSALICCSRPHDE